MNLTGVIVILGSPNDTQGRLSSIALERCMQVFAEHQRHPKYAILPTGGWGPHFNTTNKPHGYYTRRDLLGRGIPDEAFLPCVESSNTIEDAALSRAILGRYPQAKLIVVTSDFHEARARFLFEREFPERTITMSTSTTDLPPDQLTRRVAHEEKALAKLKKESKQKYKLKHVG